ncbi:PAS domain-containing protein [Massilia sp. IC2-278]|uniref:CheR family methyltransferase n=1 Tax=Massilia sp. IC2-278 TaxID=2887200 RepID=UPI001E2A9AB3|nr:CheR family methyltransferase [Massilia sp. IC2-278]MCC2962873.1 PAS domain-containing protein [Massilia sp. IC2-278]
MDEQQHIREPLPAADGAAGFPVVGIGASAGGLPALIALLENLPAAPGMAFVIVLHLSPDHPSSAARLLQRATQLPVIQVSERTRLLPDHVYVISPGHGLTMKDGHLLAGERRPLPGIPMTINIFFRTLAVAHGEGAIGIVLSGMGSDGVAGLACIKEHGGVTLAQAPGEAEESGMPQAAVDAGAADFVLPAAQMPARLVDVRNAMRMMRQQQQERRGATPAEPPRAADGLPRAGLDAILSLLWSRTGHDFRHYKQATILRRLERRMQIHGAPDMAAYLLLLQRDHGEIQALLQDLLIGVTSFFRDRDAFAALGEALLPRLGAAEKNGGQFRAWVAACSTGEEAYSLAMLLAEPGGAPAATSHVQIFATDTDERAIVLARAGRYPQGIAADMAPGLLARWFTSEDGGYKVRKVLRDRILFAHHDLLHDPAFSRLDLITCRNVLIYLNRDLHRHVLEMFHSALNPGGYLFLGEAESADCAPDLFAPVSARHRLYQAIALDNAARRLSMSTADTEARRQRLFLAGATAPAPEPRPSSFAAIHEQALLRLAPPSVLLNAEGDVVHATESAAAFLRHGGGELSTRILALVLPELRTPLRTLLLQVQETGMPARSGPLQYVLQERARSTRIAVSPAPQAGAGAATLVAFEETDALGVAPPPGRGAAPEADGDELACLRRTLRQTIDQAELSTSRLVAANDTLRETVKAMRATIDELEIGHEELQSRNEELHTVNAELRMRVDETAKANDDLRNLIASTDIATLFLDRELRIQRYTPRATRIFNLIPADAGRPLAHITNRLDHPRLLDDAAAVVATLEPSERELRSSDGRDYILRMHPYRTAYDRVEGVVLTFFDISQRRLAEDALRESEERFRAFVTASSDMLYKMSPDWSEMRTLQGKNILADTDDPTCSWIEKYIPEDARPEVLATIGRAIANKSTFELEHRVFRADGEIAWTFSRAIPMLGEDGKIVEWFGAGSDITERKRGEEALRASEVRLAAELSGARLLQRLSTSLIPGQRPEALYDAILDAALSLAQADAATIQLLDPGGGRLRLIAARNIHPQSAAFWHEVDTGHATACGRSVAERRRAVVEDTDTDPAMAGTADLEELRRSGIRAIQSTPLSARSGRLIGLISTHWRQPRRFSDDDFTLFDVLARQLADLIERTQAEDALREHEARHRADLERQVQERTAELKQSHDLLQATMDASTDMIQVFEAVRGETGEIVDFMWALNNYTSETRFGKVEGESLLERNPGVVETGIFDAFRQVAETGEPISAERHYVHEQFDGWFLQTVVKLGDGVATTTKDISAWKAAQEEVQRLRDEMAQTRLRESEAKYRELIDFIPAAVYACQADGRLVYYNARAAALWGREPQDGDPAWSLLGSAPGQEGAEDAASPLATVLASGEPVVNREMRIERPDGSRIDILVNITALRNASGGIDGAINIFQDISERKRAEEALRTADRRKDEFLATLAHELRNPLAPISNALQFVRHPEGRRNLDALLDMVARQVRQMVRLVDDLMEVTRISRGKVELRCAPVALAEVLHCALETSAPSFEQKGQYLGVALGDEALVLDADKVRLTQVFSNLLNNASKYTGHGGQIWLRASRDGREAVVSVRDTGMGIAPDQLPLIFQMFSQPHGRAGHTDSGLGIGLAMVRSLVQLHGGRVEARSGGSGQGSEFLVRLPLCERANGPAGGEDLDTGASLDGLRILVVDDNRDAADSLCQLLAARGAHTGACYDGAAALAQLGASALLPQAVVLDIGMPGMDGCEVAERIRADARLAGVRLVALSGWGQRADRERSQACGFDHHLTKPAELPALVRILRQDE